MEMGSGDSIRPATEAGPRPISEKSRTRRLLSLPHADTLAPPVNATVHRPGEKANEPTRPLHLVAFPT